MGKIRELADWVKTKLGKGESRIYQSGKINIIRRNDTTTQSAQQPVGSRITIGTVHTSQPPTAAGYRPEVPVENPDLSGGIHVARRRKPGTCPMCRSTGTVVDNPGGRPRWKCSACEHTFN